jgi:4-diphosphocytidyl-2-C-methyl-D-erythritol kinase
MLRILGQRQDGYHLLQTYFQLLDWGDEMKFDLINTDTIIVEGDFGNLKQQDNLIDKAARLLLPYRKVDKGIKISVNKNIPQGSGLGGGSSNAGTCLRILNTLWLCEIPQQKLQKMALTLGADVPVFVQNQSAMAKGVGEQLTAYTMDSYFYVLIFPKTNISTVDVFSHKDLQRDQQEIPLQEIKNKKHWSNACLSVVLANYPEVALLYSKASQFAPVYLSGTGSTLFSCFDTVQNAQEFIKQCTPLCHTKLCKSQIPIERIR